MNNQIEQALRSAVEILLSRADFDDTYPPETMPLNAEAKAYLSCKSALTEINKCEPNYYAIRADNRILETFNDKAGAENTMATLKSMGTQFSNVEVLELYTSPISKELVINGEWSKEVMEGWDLVRSLIANGDNSSYPRDWFESLAPIEREWVGLSEDDELHLKDAFEFHGNEFLSIKETEAKLKQLNTKG